MTEKLAEGKNPGINGGFDRVVDRRTALKIIGGILGGSALAALGVTEVIEKIMDTNASKEAAAIPVSSLTKKTISMSGATATEKPTATATKEATATAVATKTEIPTPTEIPDPQIIEMDKVELAINGKAVEFVVGREEESDILSTWSKWGITGVETNKNLTDYQNKFNKLIPAILQQESPDGAKVSFEEFLANSDKYPIGYEIYEPGRQLSSGEKTFLLSDVKRVEYRFVAPDDPRLFGAKYHDHFFWGYKLFENGTLTVYNATVPEDDNLANMGDIKYFKYVPLAVGDVMGQNFWFALFIMDPSIDNVTKLDSISTICELPVLKGKMMTVSQVQDYEITRGLWIATFD